MRERPALDHWSALHLGDIRSDMRGVDRKGCGGGLVLWQFHRNSHRDAVLRKKSERYRSTPHYRSRSLKMKSARFKKASQEIGVPRGNKSERYRSTPHYRS